MSASDPIERFLEEAKTQLTAEARAGKGGKGKGKGVDDATNDISSPVRSRQDILDGILRLLRPSEGVSADDLGASGKLGLALDILLALLRSLASTLESNSDGPTPSFSLTAGDEETIATIVWEYWESGVGLTQKLRSIVAALRAYSDAAYPNLPVDQRPTVSTLFRLVSGSVLASKRSLSILLLLVPDLEPATTLSVLSAHATTPTELLLVFLDPIGDLRLATTSGSIGVAWTLRCRNSLASFDDWLRISASKLIVSEERARWNLCQYYLLPFLKVHPAGYRLLIHELASHTSASSPQARLGATISLAQIFNPLNALLSKTDKLPDDAISCDDLRSCLAHPSFHLRSAALSVVCDSTSPSVPVSSRSFDLLRDYFRWNVGETEAEMKMHLSSVMVHFLARLRDSSYAAAKKASDLRRKGPEADAGIIEHEAYVDEVRQFVVWLATHLVDNINPTSPYRTQGISLQLLELLLETGVDPLHPPSAARTGTFPRPKKDPGPARPQVMPFHVTIATPSLVRSLIRCLTSTYNDVRAVAFRTLQRLPSPLPGFEAPEAMAEAVVGPALEFIHGRREAENSTGSLLLRLVMEKEILSGRQVVPQGLMPSREASSSKPSALGCFFTGRLDDLEDRILQAEKDLAKGSETAPVQGCLSSINHALAALSTGQLLALHSAHELSPLLHRTRTLVHRVWTFSRVVLCAAAPEGHDVTSIPDVEEARAQQLVDRGGFEGDEGDEDVDTAAGPRHRVILSACWRGMKEASGLYTRLIQAPAVAGPTVLSSCWTDEELAGFGAAYEDWLLGIRHRGAFSAIAPSYGDLARALCELPAACAASRLPATWLTNHIEALTSREVSFTRRSAGLPYCILAACQAISTKGDALASALQRLGDIARDEASPVDWRIHAMNTLKVLHTDSKLPGSVVGRFVERSFALAIAGFTSSDWRIRNVAMILFAGLTHRTFGQRALGMARDHAVLSSRETVTDFFRRYPSLRGILLTELERSISENLHQIADTDRQSPLYSVLLLLSLLQTPVKVSQSAALEFMPFVETCATSKVSKIRAISADTMTALLCPEDALDKTVTILRVQDRAGFNAIHGRLLQAKRLLQVPSALSSGDRTTLQAALENTKVHWLSTSLPFSCRTVFLDILETARRRFGIEVDVVKCLELDMSIRGPAGCTFETAATRYLVHGPSAASQAREALQSGVPARALSALETLEAARIDDHTVEQAVLKLARCSDLSVVLRLPALEALAMDSAEERWPVEDILDEYQNASLPIQQKLLPLAAGSLSSAAAPPTRVFDAIHLATGEQESVDTRMSAALAIRNLSPRIISFDRQVQVQIFEEIITLFQDDEEDIRDQVSDVVGGLLHDGLPVVPARGIELVLRHLRDHLGVNLADRLVQTDLSQDVEELVNPSTLLFATERANLYRDDLLEIRLTASLAEGTITAVHLPAFINIASRLRQVSVDSTLLGTTSRRSWWRIAMLVAEASRLLPDDVNSDLQVQGLTTLLDRPIVQ